MIEVKNITKSFGSLKVLKGVDIFIKKGEIATIVGKSGAGKTTLLQIMGTLLKADSGIIKINNKNINKLKTKELSLFRNKNIAFVFQFHHLLKEFTAIENVCIPAFIANKPKKETEEKAKELLNFLKISDRFNHKPNELSGGEQQRVAVARALINQPSIIFADEPSGNLDTQNKEELHNLFFELRDKFKQTFVIVTHDISLSKLSDKQIKMEDGKIKNN